jgi:rhodanese-related sulfurtransferase
MMILEPDLFLAELALSDDSFLIDIRTSSQIEEDKPLAGSIHLDFLELNFDQSIKTLDPYSQFFIYCQNGILSERAAKHLKSIGINTVFILQGGKNAWNLIFKTSIHE